MKHLIYKPYVDEKARWPDRGRVILAQYDEDSIVVYQAFNRQIGHYAAGHGRLDAPGFDPERMSWIRPSFLWMMHCCEWASARDQEVVLAIWLWREAFDALLAHAIHSRYDEKLYESREAWQAALEASGVRLQWDSDYAADGSKLTRRAIQLGLRGEALRRYTADWLFHVEDISDFVRQQAPYRHEEEFLLVPAQRIYPVRDPVLSRWLGLDRSVP